MTDYADIAALLDGPDFDVHERGGLPLINYCRCDRRHRREATFLRCAIIPAPVWVTGSGRFALIAWCDVPSVTLWQTVEQAQGSKAFIDRFGCGHGCVRGAGHSIVAVETGRGHQ